jgi:hypothetical protein
MTIHYTDDDEIERLRDCIDQLSMALEPSAIDGDEQPEIEARELLNMIAER